MSNVVVLVLVWNGRRFLQECMSALLAQDFLGTYSILAVDNASTDGSAEFLQAEFPQVALLRNSTNLGFAGGNNTGLRALLAGRAPAPIDFVPDIVVLLNQDTIVAPDWLRQMVSVFDCRQSAGIVGCKIFFPDDQTLQHAGGELTWPLAYGQHRGAGEADTGQYDTEEPVEYVTGAAMAIHRRVFEQIGLLDEGFTPAYYEDVDLCYRARAAGFEVVYAPAARLTHDENSSLQPQSAAHQRTYHRNRVRFVLKHCPAGQVVGDFVPDEVEDIRRWSIANSLARKHAYLEGILCLPALLRQHSTDGMVYDQLTRALRLLHQAVVDEERQRRAETGYRLPQTEPAPTTDDDRDDSAHGADAAPSEKTITPSEQTAASASAEISLDADETPVDVAAIMRQIRRKIDERQAHISDGELEQAIAGANQQWNTIYEPLELPAAGAMLGRVWDRVRVRFHHEVRAYLDPMIYRQTEFNSSVVRALNRLFHRGQARAGQSEIEALRDEVIQLRDQVRRLEERSQ